MQLHVNHDSDRGKNFLETDFNNFLNFRGFLKAIGLKNQVYFNQYLSSNQALIPKIQAAIASVTLGKEITLHQARAIDDYQDPIAARGMDQDLPWSEIPAEWIEKFYDVFCVLDPLGMRHALPAYILWGFGLTRWIIWP